MIQHAAFPVECLPRGLESCRYGGTVRVAFSVLGPDSNGERSSMPSEAISSTVERWRAEAAGTLLAAPSLQSARRSSRQLVVWCRVSPGPAAPVTVAWRRRGSAVVPALLTDITRGGLWMRAELSAAHWWNFIWKNMFRDATRLRCAQGFLHFMLHFHKYQHVVLEFQISTFCVRVFWKNSLINNQMFPPSATRCHYEIDLCIIYRPVGTSSPSIMRGSHVMFLLNHLDKCKQVTIWRRWFKEKWRFC